MDAALAQGLSEYGGRKHVFCHDQKPGGIPVEAVDYPVDEIGIAQLMVGVPGQGISEGVIVIALGRVNRQSCLFVDDQKILILVDDIQRNFCFDNVIRAGFLQKEDLQFFTGAEAVGGVNLLTIDGKSEEGNGGNGSGDMLQSSVGWEGFIASVCAAQMLDDMLRVSVPTKKGLNAEALFLV